MKVVFPFLIASSLAAVIRFNDQATVHRFHADKPVINSKASVHKMEHRVNGGKPVRLINEERPASEPSYLERVDAYLKPRVKDPNNVRMLKSIVLYSDKYDFIRNNPQKVSRKDLYNAMDYEFLLASLKSKHRKLLDDILIRHKHDEVNPEPPVKGVFGWFKRDKITA
jgi:hypothetical protein